MKKIYSFQKSIISFLVLIMIFICLPQEIYAANSGGKIITATKTTQKGDNKIEEKSAIFAVTDDFMQGIGITVKHDKQKEPGKDKNGNDLPNPVLPNPRYIINEYAGENVYAQDIKVYIKNGDKYEEASCNFSYLLSGEMLESGYKYAFTLSCDVPEGDAVIRIDYVNPKTGELKRFDNISVSHQHENVDGGNPTGFWARLWGFITDTFETAASLIEEIIVELFIYIGDGLLYMITASVGEVVTIDRVIFNGVSKVNINFWEGIDTTTQTVKSTMAQVVRPWYSVFYKIAILVYVATLVFVGIQVLLNSTAEKKAKYKEVMVSWVVGVAILTLFPFVMKYIVKINETAVAAMYAYHSNGDTMDPNGIRPWILSPTTDEFQPQKYFGSDYFIVLMETPLTQNPNGPKPSSSPILQNNTLRVAEISDSMLKVRAYAHYKSKFILIAIYFILMGETFVLLFMYYKRVFMLAFLITIFPLVAMTYVLDRVGDKKAQSFNIWFKEFIVNVFVQTFHAATYIVVVSSSIQNFINTNGQNWFFTIISVLFLFEGEKVMRNIFGVNSSASTISDLAATGAAIYGITKVNGGKGQGDTGSKQDKSDVAAATSRINARADRKNSIQKAGEAGGGAESGLKVDGGSKNTELGAPGSYQGDDPAGVDTKGYDGAAAKDSVIKSAMSRRIAGGIASKGIKGVGKALGKVAGVTYGMSKGDTADGSMMKNALADGVSGGMIGSAAVTPISYAANKVEQRIHGNIGAKKIERGERDEELTLNIPEGMSMPGNIDPNEVVGKHGETMQEIYRKALAEMYRVAARKGKARGELAYWNFIDENMRRE